MIDGLGASALGVWLAWVFRLEQITFKSRAHSLVLVSVLAIGAGAIWLCARHVGPAPATVREALPYVAALLGLFLTTSLPDRGVERLRRMLDANDANRNRLLASGGVALLLLVSIPLAQGAIRRPESGLIALAALTLRILTPIPAVVPIALGVAAGLLLG